MSKMARRAYRQWTLEQILPWLLLIGGGLALLASFALTMEKFNSLQNPAYVPVCDLNPVISCGAVSNSDQAAAFGFPNPFLGLVGYTALAAAGLALLAGAKLKRWFWLGLEIGLAFAIVFVHWLAFEALYRIGGLCIFCMVVWAVTAPMFWYLTLYNLRAGHIKTPPAWRRAAAFAQKHHGDILLGWFLLIAALIAKRFWYYWSGIL